MSTDNVFRVINISLALAIAVVMGAALISWARLHAVSLGEVLSRSGGVVICLCIVFGTSEILFGWTSTYRLPALMVGLTWTLLGQILILRDAIRARRAQRREHPIERQLP